LARLETSFGVSQKGVQVIAAEMIHLANRVLAHCMNSVTQHLGKLYMNLSDFYFVYLQTLCRVRVALFTKQYFEKKNQC
jgi:hypothetical protein